MDKEEKRNEGVPIIIFFVAIGVFLTPFIIYAIAICNGEDSGKIGDTIGGSTAPIIGLLSATLLYFSFSSQVKANKIAREEANFKYLLDEFERMKLSMEKFCYEQKTAANSLTHIPKHMGILGMKELTTDLFVKYHPAAAAIPSIATNLKDSTQHFLFYTKVFYVLVKEVADLNQSQHKNYKLIIESKIKLYYDENFSTKLDLIIALSFDNEQDGDLKQNLIELRKIARKIKAKIGEFEEEEETEL